MTQTVIVIDDDEDTVRLFSEFLEEHKIHVLGKGYDGKTAVKMYQEKKPDNDHQHKRKNSHQGRCISRIY